ncbi:LLM class flavin-dependent oxidoreductase [Micromonospora sp. AMSO31t]|uniref:LLM class flavin-dependent oxidoreductase n=1 Tax=Micromonospora sp. AMSO31t TaxID=2650566 RepID=UPI00124BA26B|nr:LLM class flavin-dependent oxidoreductase [Micromonospora sp. AMSO31t]KAB1911665.1 LLM class flavin-dependent oxidoreductase [Micromonospora sp. AMSO31t]
MLAGHRAGGSHAQALSDAHCYGLAAENAGFAGVWIAEHHFISYGVCPSATTFAAHLLGATRRITVGTAACVLSVRHPVSLAEEAVLLDELSGGRFRLAIARGGPWVDVEVFGTGENRYTHGMADAVEILLRWMSGAATVAGGLPGLLAGTREHVRLDGGESGPPDIDAYVRQLIAVHPVGSPQRCRAAVAAAATLPGVRHLLFLVEATGDRATTLHTIGRLSSEVLHGP